VEKQYIFFNKGKAFALFTCGMLFLIISAGSLAFLGVGKYTAGVLLVLVASVVIWTSFKLDAK